MAIPLAAALLALALWAAEVNLALGWEGTAWLNIRHAPRLIPVVIGAVLLAVGPRPAWKQATMFVGGFWLLALGCTILAGTLLSSAYQLVDDTLAIGAAAVLLAVFAPVCAVGTWLLQRLLTGPAPLRLIPAYIVALNLVLPLSLVSRYLVPWPGVNVDLLHAIKAGWPAFWTTLLMGCAAMLWVHEPPDSPAA